MSVLNVINRILDRRIHEDNMGGWASCIYDFTLHGGAVGDIVLSLDLPATAIINYGYVNVLTAPTSAGSATVAARINGTADLLGATAIASITNLNAMVPNWAVGNMIRLTADRKLILTVAVAALTAGRLEFRLRYDVPSKY